MADKSTHYQGPGAGPAFGSTAAKAVRAAGWYAHAAVARADRCWLALALLPALLWAANPNWLFNRDNDIDSWVYFGYFLNLPVYKASWFPYQYYGSRLPWILPGYLIHQIFEVVTAQYVLHFGVYSLATFAFYWLLREAVGRRNALLATVLFGCQPAFLLATGWDYVDGPGCAFTLAALACALRAGKSPAPRIWLLAAGVAAAGMVYTNLILLLFFPGVLAFYVFPRHTTLNWKILRTAAGGTLWIGTGSFGLSLILALINHALDGAYFFYAPSLLYASNTVGKANAWTQTDWAWLAGAIWLVFPAIAVVTTIAFLMIGRMRHGLQWNDTRVLFSANYLACFGAMLVWEINKGYAFEHLFYVSYLVPPLFLAVGCQISGPLDVWRKPWYWTAVTSFAILMATPFRLIGLNIMKVQTPDLRMLVLIGAAALVVRVWWPNRGLALITVLLVFGWLQYTSIAYAWYGLFLPPGRDNAAILRRIAKSVEIVRAEAANERPRFWYNRAEKYGKELWAINSSYLWQYTYVSYTFPEILAGSAPEPDALVVILSALPRDMVLSQAAKGLAPLHLKATFLSRKDIGGRYFLMFVRIHDSQSERLQAAKIGAGGIQLVVEPPSEEGLPPEHWTLLKYPASSSSLARTRDGVMITTASQRDAYGAKYGPLTAPKDGLYRFSLTYRLQRGSLVFGALAGDESSWMAHGTPLSPGGRVRVDRVSLHLRAGERIVLMTCNGASQSSTYELLSLRATVIADQPSVAAHGSQVH
jgi:4-amino-4-deoxy-L-arabinose transferase-like glycosyltransferase